MTANQGQRLIGHAAGAVLDRRGRRVGVNDAAQALAVALAANDVELGLRERGARPFAHARRGEDLDGVGAARLEIAHHGAELRVRLHGLSGLIVAEPLQRGQQSRPRHQVARPGRAQREIPRGARSQALHRREAGLEDAHAVFHAEQDRVGHGLVLSDKPVVDVAIVAEVVGHVNVGVDQSRRHGQAAEIVDLGPLWDRPANAFDLVARDDDHGVS